MLNSLAVSLVRTYTPAVVGAVVGAGAYIGLDLDSTLVANGVGAVAFGAYYTLARVLEERLSPTWGYLLGVARRPEYEEGGED